MLAELQAPRNDADSTVLFVLLDTCSVMNQLAKARHDMHTSHGGATHWPGTKLSSLRPSEQINSRCVLFDLMQDDPNCVHSLLSRHLLLAVAAA
jgi:hypothetical protein